MRFAFVVLTAGSVLLLADAPRATAQSFGGAYGGGFNARLGSGFQAGPTPLGSGHRQPGLARSGKFLHPRTPTITTTPRDGIRKMKAAVFHQHGPLDNLRYEDPFLVCADYASYLDCQERVSTAWQDRESWTAMSILNTARSGKFSSDRAITEYCDEIWNVWPLTVKI